MKSARLPLSTALVTILAWAIPAAHAQEAPIEVTPVQPPAVSPPTPPPPAVPPPYYAEPHFIEVPAPRRFEVRLAFSYSFVHPTALEGLLNSSYAFNSSYGYSGAPGFWTEFDYLPSQSWAIGIRLDYLTAWTGQSIASTINVNDSLSALNFYAVGAYRWQVTDVFRIRPEIGVGVPIYYDYYTQRISNLYYGDALYSSNPFTAFGSVTAEIAPTRDWTVNLEVGYRYLRAANMGLDWNNLYPFINLPGNLGAPADLSSVYFSVGAGFAF